MRKRIPTRKSCKSSAEAEKRCVLMVDFPSKTITLRYCLTKKTEKDMIKYVIQAKRNPANPEQTKYYPQMAPSTPITLAQVVKRIEKRSTVSSADVKAVLDALQYEVVEALADGNSIRLNDLGSFRLTITANGVDSAAEAKKQGARLIKQVNVKFTKSTAMRDALDVRNLDFAPQADIKNAIGGSESGGEGGNEGGGGSEGGGTGDDNSPMT